ncbi:hypothetical protein LSH36_477g01000 [Paralvinella palmiformis]|uniref:ODAD1 central coiled coil region domain-containing protein n=1 Tax=Paralvinella palmiformis TaxID=53620 RepID=A0AAD9JAC0_9ANNE|nr:hypothetical protein LSH36_477g01000 [Paralvinella palmiformis]
MPRPRSPAHSDISDGEADGNEAELARLQRRYRVMENDRKAYCQESQDVIKRQRAEIAALQAEQEEILKNMRLIESQSNQEKDNKNCENLGELGRTKQEIEQQIKEERTRHNELNSEIREWEKKKRDQQKKAGGSASSSQHTTKTSKDIRKLENRLQLANNKFCKALEENKGMRDDIDSLRVERRRFEDLYKRLEKERQKLKEEIGQIIDEATQAHDQRDEAQSKMILLKEKSDKDIQQHETEMKELIRIIDHDRRLKEFMNSKNKDRPEDSQLVKWRQEREAHMAEKLKASQTDSVDSYEEAFQKIKEMRKEENVEKLVSDFIRVEDQNFALFNYVNEQNHQIETLQEQIDEIKSEIESFKSQGVELEEQRKAILKTLDEKQSHAAQKADEFDEKYKEVSKILDQLRAGIESLFNKTNCDSSSIDDMLGSKQGVTNQNMIQYLGIIEEKTNQLLLAQTYLANKEDEDGYVSRKRPALLGDGPQPPAPKPLILPPAVGEYDSDTSDASEEGSRPLTHGELTHKVMKSVKKREQEMRKNENKYDLSEAADKKSKKKDKKVKY